jgi:Uma2 family endonuclease
MTMPPHPCSYSPPPSSEQLIVDDGQEMETARHRQQMTVLIESLEDAWRHRDDFYVGGNMFLYYSETQVRKNDFRGPDVFVVLDTTRRERKAWVVWEEDGRTPNVIIELTSESTTHADHTDKMRIYGKQLRVPEYFIFDPLDGELEGYSLNRSGDVYEAKQADAEGRLYCEPLGLFLQPRTSKICGVEARWLRWVDATGNVLSLPQERADAEARRADAEAQRADAEAQRADAEAQRVKELERQLAALRDGKQ